MYVVWIILRLIFDAFFFRNLNLNHFWGNLTMKENGQWAQLLQFYANSFKTLHVLWAWSEYMHVVWIYNPQIIFCHFFAI